MSAQSTLSVPALQVHWMLCHLYTAAAAARIGTLSSVMDHVRQVTATLANLECLGDHAREMQHALPRDGNANGAYYTRYTIVETLCGGGTRLYPPLSLTTLLHTSKDAALPLVYNTAMRDLQVSVSCCRTRMTHEAAWRVPSVIPLRATNLRACQPKASMHACTLAYAMLCWPCTPCMHGVQGRVQACAPVLSLLAVYNAALLLHCL